MSKNASMKSTPKQASTEVSNPASADLWLGLQVRAMRKSAGLSLKELAEKAGLSIGMISQIERGAASPSIRSLRQISEALKVPTSLFFQEGDIPPANEIGRIVRNNARRIMMLRQNGVSKELLTPDFSGTVELLLIRLEPGGTSGPEYYTHKGEEAGLVLCGAIKLWVEEDSYILKAGDSFRFKSTLPHRYCSASDEVTEVLWVDTPPYY
ncbi:cupin domain-containing protein [Pseudaminobacter arsenicus]|uniref:Cupin domain-containing protein n=2 Tax=Borborobacter arsenicus TaxID=1851146 RepID=A0A432VBJ3_9HYPH|nr:cupin domain-containing protein [Pseudaminobacter arsenicus]